MSSADDAAKMQPSDLEFHPTDNALRDVALEGEISEGGPSSEEDHHSTLDEPVRVTVLRDLKAVGSKFLHVLYPKSSTALLREWDLWGPLFLCIMMGILLQSSSQSTSTGMTPVIGDGGPQFAEVFGIFWLGAAIVTLNAKLLGGDISFFQSVCVLGYCVLPLVVSLIVCRILLMINNTSMVFFIIRLVFVACAFGWSTFASTAFMTSDRLPKRRALAIYPVFLFYFVISWLIISHAKN